MRDRLVVDERAKSETQKPAASSAERGPHLDEALEFHRMMSGVIPLDQKRARIPRSQDSVDVSASAERVKKRIEEGQARADVEAAHVHEHLRALVEGKLRFEVQDDGVRVEGRRVDVPPSVLRSLRHGALPIDARIDLHGRSATQAREELGAFLSEQRAKGEKCVLVVHGKGEHSPDGVGVLRGEIAAWLSQGRASEHVAAFSTAAPPDGGEGAVYVLLKR